ECDLRQAIAASTLSSMEFPPHHELSHALRWCDRAASWTGWGGWYVTPKHDTGRRSGEGMLEGSYRKHALVTRRWSETEQNLFGAFCVALLLYDVRASKEVRQSYPILEARP